MIEMTRRTGWLVAALACWSVIAAPLRAQEPAAGRPVVVGSKPFGESYLLAELFAQILEARGLRVTRTFGLGGTEIVFPALQQGAIDVFPEYTGSGLLVILKAPMASDPAAVFDTVSREFAARYDARWLAPLGFENTYAMSVRTEMADAARFTHAERRRARQRPAARRVDGRLHRPARRVAGAAPGLRTGAEERAARWRRR